VGGADLIVSKVLPEETVLSMWASILGHHAYDLDSAFILEIHGMVS